MARVFLPILLVLTAVTACGRMYKPEYTIVLTSVEVTPGTGVFLAGQSATGEPRSQETPAPLSETAFQDDWLRTDWILGARKLDVEVKNLGRLPLLVRCDEAAYIAVDGSTHRVTRRDLRKAEAAVLPAGQAEKMPLYPADFLAWEKGKEVEWKTQPLVPSMPGIASSERKRAEEFGRGQVGAVFKLDLPVELDGETRVYRYVFTVKEMKVLGFRGT